MGWPFWPKIKRDWCTLEGSGGCSAPLSCYRLGETSPAVASRVARVPSRSILPWLPESVKDRRCGRPRTATFEAAA